MTRVAHFDDSFASTSSEPTMDSTTSTSATADPESDPEDDPGHMLNVWLGELNTMKRSLTPSVATSAVSKKSSLESPTKPTVSSASSQPPVMRRQQQNNKVAKEIKDQYRGSLINIEESQDDELDAILGELSILESQFANELAKTNNPNPSLKGKSSSSTKRVEIIDPKTDVRSEAVDQSRKDESSDRHSSSSNGSSENSNKGNITNGKRTESPDNDSAFCDNLSVLSSCSASSSSKTDQSKSSGVSSSTSPTSEENQEAKIKAEKIKLAIEKIKEANIKKLFVKVFTADGSAKSLMIDEKMSVGHVTRILAEKNLVKLDPKWSIVELVPELYMERVYEDHENLVENCLMWTTGSKNTLWFVERPEKYDLFSRPELYLLGSSSSQKGEPMEEHSRRELIDEFFSASGVGAPEVEGYVWLKAESKKSWKKFFFVLRSSGLYYAPKGKKTSRDLVCLATFDVNQVYYGSGWRRKYKAPTDYCFAIKHPQIQAKSPKYIRYLCVESERELHQWVTGIRVAKNGRHIYENHRAIEEEITHADIDILTSKRLSVNSPSTLQIPNCNGAKSNGNFATYNNANTSPALTPSSNENKSFSSGIASDFSHVSNSENGIAPMTNGWDCSSSETGSSSQHTPVNTIERMNGGNNSNMGTLRPMSRSSKTSSTSSSSGCLSDRSSVPESSMNGSLAAGFESDFPAGGTIKKRPGVSPRLPLTNTTWGLVSRDSDEQNSDQGDASNVGPNVRVGSGGTLLRSAMMRSSLRKSSLKNNSNGILENNVVDNGIGRQKVLADVHREEKSEDVDPMSAEFESSLGSPHQDPPLPPPPRDESLEMLANSTSVHGDEDDLPPPPPELCLNEQNEQFNAIMSQASPLYDRIEPPRAPKPIPTPLPPTLKRDGHPQQSRTNSFSNGPTKRISFDDNVQMIDDFVPRRSPMPPPNKLYPDNVDTTTSKAAPPREFLQDLQRVMNKKWQVAEKCRTEVNTNPHQVLGFRDEIQHLVGSGLSYSRDNSVGAWILQTQQFSNDNETYAATSEPLYAVSTKRNNASHYAQHRQQQHPHPSNKPPPPPPPPVILREPTPDQDSYYTNGHYYTQNSQEVSNYSTLRYASNNNSGSTGSLNRRTNSPSGKPPAPPPPRRSENTQLTTTLTS